MVTWRTLQDRHNKHLILTMQIALFPMRGVMATVTFRIVMRRRSWKALMRIRGRMTSEMMVLPLSATPICEVKDRTLSAAWMLLIMSSDLSGLATFVELAPSLVSPLPIELKSWN